jgi:hypothetical protein
MRSTKRWIAEVGRGLAVEGGKRDVGVRVEGRRVVEGGTGVKQAGKVNDLGGMIVRKKRKVEDGAVGGDANGREVKKVEEVAGETVNVLGAGMVRKKAKKA